MNRSTLVLKRAFGYHTRLASRPLVNSGPGHRLFSSLTSMSATTLKPFVIWAPDYTDEGAFDRRLAVREKHLATAKDNEAAGYVTNASGPFLTPESIASPDAPKKLIGSMLIVKANSVAEVKAKVETDVYWTGNVWDKEKLTVYPFGRPFSSLVPKSTDGPTLHTFAILLPDYKDEGTSQRRDALSGEYLTYARARVAAGYMTEASGPLLDPESSLEPGAPKKPIGSLMVVKAESLEQAKEDLKSAPYWDGNVWDKENIDIYPYLLPV